jgi:hypothetical protein
MPRSIQRSTQRTLVSTASNGPFRIATSVAVEAMILLVELRKLWPLKSVLLAMTAFRIMLSRAMCWYVDVLV